MSVENKSLKKKIEELAANYERLLVEMYEAGRLSSRTTDRHKVVTGGDGEQKQPTLDLWRADETK